MKSFLSKAVPAILLMAVFSALGCATYNITRVISKQSELNSLKKSGIIFRLPHASVIKYDEYARSLQFFLNTYKKNNDMKIIGKADGKLLAYPSELERFYQVSINGDYQKYKSQGAIYQILHEKETALRSLMEKEDLDSIIICEVEGDFSTEMQYISFTSLLTIVDSKLDILYLDHQSINLDIDEFDPAKAKNNLLDSVAKRIIGCLEDINFVDEQ